MRLVAQLVIALLSLTATATICPATPESVSVENRRADTLGLKRYITAAEVHQDVLNGRLVPIPLRVARLPRERRYVLPGTASFLSTLDARFHQMTGHRLVVTSAVRAAEIQRRIARHNRSAAAWDGNNPSSHERGTTVDLSRRMPRRDYRYLMTQLLYYRAVGQILVIEERRCIHIFVGGENHDD